MRNYARAAVEMDGGDLYSIFEVSVKEGNGGKVEHTFRKSGAGMSFGNVEIDMTFKVKKATTKSERDWRGLVRNRTITQLTVKYPDGSKDVVDGAFTDRDGQQGLEGAYEETLNFKGTAS
jgi:hypothetical protein